MSSTERYPQVILTKICELTANNTSEIQEIHRTFNKAGSVLYACTEPPDTDSIKMNETGKPVAPI
ncbi:hypothetical protein [Pseudochrobactrum sp. B5]|uniref:hypothetical protein n=1 Tax=Pseudochrobactrum sp. B5 TaxID=1289478 RepID=UPI0009519FBD|nr:hypothetical protein [Pseudochrobactrum sp. B5]